MSSPKSIEQQLLALGAQIGGRIRSDRARRRMTQRALAEAAGISGGMVAWVEAGNVPSTETYLRLANALGLRFEIDLVDPRRKTQTRAEDPVHAAMGEWVVRLLRPLGYPVALDEPYQHYQFAGRADALAWQLEPPALLHVENRTRFPNLQDAFGSYNAKRIYLPGVLAQRLGLRHGFRSATNVLSVLRSAEVLHDLRLRTESFAVVCPDPLRAVTAWLAGTPPDSGVYSVLAIVDPIAQGRTRAIVGLDDVRTIRPRYRGYADAAEAFRRAGL